MNAVTQMNLFMWVIGLGIVLFLVYVAVKVIGGLGRERAHQCPPYLAAANRERRRHEERAARVYQAGVTLVDTEEAANEVRRQRAAR